MLLGALAELASVGAIIPFLTLLLGQSLSPHLEWIGTTFDGFGSDRRDRLIGASAALVILVVAAAAIRLALVRMAQKFVFGLGHDLAVDVQRLILLQPYSFHVAQNTSALLAAHEKIQGLINVLQLLIQAVIAIFISLFIIAGLVYFDPFTALVAAAAFSLVYMLVSAVARKRLARNSRVIGSAYNQRIKIVQESLGGIRDVIIDSSQQVYVDAFSRADQELNRAHASTAFIGAAPRFVIEAFGMVLIALLALAIAQRQGEFAGALPMLAALAFGAQRLLPLLQQVYVGWSVGSGNASLLSDVLALLRLPAGDEAAPGNRPDPLPLNDRITIDRLSFSYPSQRGDALRDVSLEIPRGARVALIGRTGSGKSTLADLLMGLLDPDEGAVLIDGIPLSTVNRQRWQQSIAHVPQAIFIADTSIARNIALSVGPESIDSARVVEAARKAQLDEFVASLPEGYDTIVGERGIRLSGGQRQRLGLARAIYKQAPVMILDEATSALDDATETAVVNALELLGDEGLTIIMIAHRMSTVARFPTVVRLDRGRLVEVGSFDEVVGRG